MHTVWVRLNAVVFFGLTVLLCLSILAALSKFNHAARHQPIITKLALNNMKSLKNHGGVDRALLSFDLQLFVYVIASYKTDTNPKNQIVLWDRIIENTDPPEKKILNEKNVFVKYGLVDQGAELRGKEVELSLHWDHMPLTGTLFVGKQKEGTESTFELPAEYL
jgi:signal peptidase complex subunit 3